MEARWVFSWKTGLDRWDGMVYFKEREGVIGFALHVRKRY